MRRISSWWQYIAVAVLLVALLAAIDNLTKKPAPRPAKTDSARAKRGGDGEKPKSKIGNAKSAPAGDAKPEQPAEPEPEAPKREEWVPIATFTGAGKKITEEFTISSEDYWRVTVAREGADPLAPPFTAYLHLAGEQPASPVDHGQIGGRGAGPVSVNFAERGTFYVRMDAGPQPWKIVVEELRTTYSEYP